MQYKLKEKLGQSRAFYVLKYLSYHLCRSGGIGRRAGFKIRFPLREYGFESHLRYCAEKGTESMHEQPIIGVIIPAAGSSSRFGQKDKLSEDVGGRPLLIRTVEFFTKCDAVRDIVVAGPPQQIDDFKEKFAPTLSFHGVKIVEGDAQSRALSVLNALSSISPEVFLLEIIFIWPSKYKKLFLSILL